VTTTALGPPYNYSVLHLRVTVTWNEEDGERQVVMNTERLL
jgi:hypothetical protein